MIKCLGTNEQEGPQLFGLTHFVLYIWQRLPTKIQTFECCFLVTTRQSWYPSFLSLNFFFWHFNQFLSYVFSHNLECPVIFIGPWLQCTAMPIWESTDKHALPAAASFHCAVHQLSCTAIALKYYYSCAAGAGRRCSVKANCYNNCFGKTRGTPNFTIMLASSMS